MPVSCTQAAGISTTPRLVTTPATALPRLVLLLPLRCVCRDASAASDQPAACSQCAQAGEGNIILVRTVRAAAAALTANAGGLVTERCGVG
jgi:hypothetical protein